MPTYIYKHPEEDRYVEVIQSMNEDHTYFDPDGVEWKRVLTCPKLNIDSELDPFSYSQYHEKTKNMKGNVGDLMDQSRELSEKRAAIHGGEDPVRRKHFDDWSKKRGGMIHPEDKKKRVVENKDIKIEY